METEFEPSPEAAELLRRDPDRYLSLDHAQWMFLIYGGSGCGDDFLSQADAEAMWCVHRKILLSSYLNSGRRPTAWWIFECPAGVPWRGYDQQTRVLFEHDLLGEEERSAVIRQWRAQFERGERLDDISPRLRREWRKQRCSKTEREAKPEAVAVIPDPPEQPAA